MAKIDIVVPCYNYGRFLSACISSILNQSVQDVRVLIIDDASSDHTLAVARKLAQADSRIGVIAHSQNWGHIRTYNEGIAWASADYFMLLSADDLLALGALERAAAIMDSHSDVVLTHGRCIRWRDGLPLPDIATKSPDTWARQDLVREFCAKGVNFVETPTVVVRTCVQKVIGGYRQNLPHSADMEMWLRFGAHGVVARINAVQAIYRKHSSAMSNSYFPDYQQRLEAYESFFATYKERFPNAHRLQAQIERILAERSFWTGIAQICRGNADKGRLALRFATDLRPSLRYFPPVARLVLSPDVGKRVFDFAADALALQGR